jgi:hypothetical protein
MEEDLDAILDFANNYFSAIPFTIDELFNEAKVKPMSKLWSRSLEKNVLADYVKYLVGKEYIRIECTTDDWAHYKITPEGKIHIISGGFVRQREIENRFRESTLEANHSVVSTNKSVKRTNKFQIPALVITSLIGILALLLQYFNFRRDSILNEKLVTFGIRLDSALKRLDSSSKYDHFVDTAGKIRVVTIKRDTLSR